MASSSASRKESESSVLTENMDLDAATGDENSLDHLAEGIEGIDNVALDLRDIVDLVYKDRRLFPGSLPDSPPDSSSEHLLSPGSSTSGGQFGSPPQQQQMPQMQQQSSMAMAPSATFDLSNIDYTLPMQLLDGQQDFQQGTLQDSVNLAAVLPFRGDTFHQHMQPPPQSTLVIKNEVQETSSPTDHHIMQQQQQQQPKAKRKRKSTLEAPAPPVQVKSEPLSGQELGQGTSVGAGNPSIQFSPLLLSQWRTLVTRQLHEIAPPRISVSADKGYNFSTVDDAFIAQKKNHFQLTCQLSLSAASASSSSVGGRLPLQQQQCDPHFVQADDGSLKEIDYLQLNFYGVKQEAPDSCIRVEQSQPDRSKVQFHPIRIDLSNAALEPVKVSVGRLHFTETTANNMRKKGKPNPSQKYFQMAVALEAVIADGSSNQKIITVATAASERIIVRASNPGQFEQDPGPDGTGSQGVWQRDGSGDGVFHMGRVGINTDQPTEALSVHGNIQLLGQIKQPCDFRIKGQIQELDPKKQLANVNKIKIVKYKYRPEYTASVPGHHRQEFSTEPQYGVIAQEVRKVLPEAVSSSGNFILANGKQVDDMLIVNKDRLFLENIGAVRELSKMTGSLEHRMDDLERSHETVSVRLSKLKRGGSIISNLSSSSSTGSSNYEKTRSKSHCRRGGNSLFQRRSIQLLILALIGVMTISMVTMAAIYIMDYYQDEPADDIYGLDNTTAPVDLSTASPLFGSTSRRPTFPPPTPTYFITTITADWTPPPPSLPTPPSLPPPVIGPSCSGADCQIFCCGGGGGRTNSLSGLHQAEAVDREQDYIENEVSIDNNLTAPGDDLSNVIHADVLFVEQPPGGFNDQLAKDPESWTEAEKFSDATQTEKAFFEVEAEVLNKTDVDSDEDSNVLIKIADISNDVKGAGRVQQVQTTQRASTLPPTVTEATTTVVPEKNIVDETEATSFLYQVKEEPYPQFYQDDDASSKESDNDEDDIFDSAFGNITDESKAVTENSEPKRTGSGDSLPKSRLDETGDYVQESKVNQVEGAANEVTSEPKPNRIPDEQIKQNQATESSSFAYSGTPPSKKVESYTVPKEVDVTDKDNQLFEEANGLTSPRGVVGKTVQASSTPALVTTESIKEDKFLENEIIPEDEEKQNSKEDGGGNETLSENEVVAAKVDSANMINEVLASRRVRLLSPNSAQSTLTTSVATEEVLENLLAQEEREDIDDKNDVNDVVLDNVQKTLEARAKRAVQLQRTKRVRRNSDESNRVEEEYKTTERFVSRERQSVSLVATLATKTSGNHTLVPRFCDPLSSYYHECRTNAGPANLSLAVPLSKYFAETNVFVGFALSNSLLVTPPLIVQCPLPTASSAAEESCPSTTSNQAGMTVVESALQAGGVSGTNRTFHLPLGQTTTVVYRFRYPGPAATSNSSDYLCQMLDSQLGTGFGEYNLKLYRVCDD